MTLTTATGLFFLVLVCLELFFFFLRFLPYTVNFLFSSLFFIVFFFFRGVFTDVFFFFLSLSVFLSLFENTCVRYNNKTKQNKKEVKKSKVLNKSRARQVIVSTCVGRSRGVTAEHSSLLDIGPFCPHRSAPAFFLFLFFFAQKSEKHQQQQLPVVLEFSRASVCVCGQKWQAKAQGMCLHNVKQSLSVHSKHGGNCKYTTSISGLALCCCCCCRCYRSTL